MCLLEAPRDDFRLYFLAQWWRCPHLRGGWALYYRSIRGAALYLSKRVWVVFSPGVPLFTCLRFLPVRGLPLIQVSECVYPFLFPFSFPDLPNRACPCTLPLVCVLYMNVCIRSFTTPVWWSFEFPLTCVSVSRFSDWGDVSSVSLPLVCVVHECVYPFIFTLVWWSCEFPLTCVSVSRFSDWGNYPPSYTTYIVFPVTHTYRYKRLYFSTSPGFFFAGAHLRLSMFAYVVISEIQSSSHITPPALFQYCDCRLHPLSLFSTCVGEYRHRYGCMNTASTFFTIPLFIRQDVVSISGLLHDFHHYIVFLSFWPNLRRWA